MATSNVGTYESSEAIRDFHLSSSSDTDHHLSPNTQKCPLCRELKSSFYCKDCVHSGRFHRINSLASIQYVDKYKLFFDALGMRQKLEQDCLNILNHKQKSDKLSSRIWHSKERNKILKKMVEEKKDAIISNNLKLTEIRERNGKREKSLPKYEQKVQELENYVAGRRDVVDKWHKISAEKHNTIKKLVKLRIQQLFKYIFPVLEIQPNQEEMESGDDMVCALADATQTTYIKENKWEYTDLFLEKQHSIVAPTLPSSGNYSAYNVWVARGQDAAVDSTSPLVDHNPAITISAALTYAAQLVHILSFYLNVRLPQKMFYSDFCINDMTEEQFSRRVARLNANILYLCFTQNVRPESLYSHETIHNVLQLLEDDTADLGRQGVIELPEEETESLEHPIEEDLKKSEESDSDECDSFPLEWEAVPHIQCTEMMGGAGAAAQSPQMITTQQTTSLTGGLVNSAAASLVSFWRGFTGR